VSSITNSQQSLGVPQHNKGYIYFKPVANTILNREKTEIMSSGKYKRYQEILS
jgi:hypothetical protein